MEDTEWQKKEKEKSLLYSFNIEWRLTNGEMNMPHFK